MVFQEYSELIFSSGAGNLMKTHEANVNVELMSHDVDTRGAIVVCSRGNSRARTACCKLNKQRQSQ